MELSGCPTCPTHCPLAAGIPRVAEGLVCELCLRIRDSKEPQMRASVYQGILESALTCLLIGLWSAGPARAAAPAPATQIHYDPATRWVTLLVPPQDATGHPRTPLHPEDVIVYENGQRQSHVRVQVEHAAITVGLLLEYGGRFPSLDDDAGSAVSMAAQQFLNDIGPHDRIAIWTYGDRLGVLAGFSQDHATLLGTLIDLPSPPSSELDFYDALTEALARMRALPGRRALLVVSSGRDTFSRTTFRQALQGARSSNTPIYIIDLDPALQRYIADATTPNPYGALDLRGDEARLRQLALASRGQYYSPEDMLDLSGLYDDLLERLRVRYRISYRSSAPASGPAARSVRVELLRPLGGAAAAPLAARSASAHAAAAEHPRMRLIAVASYRSAPPALHPREHQVSTGVSPREPHSVHEPSYSAPGGKPATSSARVSTAALSPEPHVVMTWLCSSTPHAAKRARNSAGASRVCCAVSSCV
jgi:VWFA-related protein